MRKLILLALIASLAACGVKNDLAKPNAQADKAGEGNPSRPPGTTNR